ncbi:hypothetical protein ZIOFF_002731 [Zingiber officinale]|uniref:Protein arginine N-methyltransferase 1 n=1 Tax=Zingiber officinale TaxID=94328 RepID=A0A8J5I5L4_ZINOF|nr:hypothetical protein ZIOFF_002731 [Zingiber officinale]
MGRRKSKAFAQENQSLVPSSSGTESARVEVEDEAMEERVESVSLDDSPLIGAENTSADYYFDSYSHFGIHEEMLKDVVRTKTYQNVIYQNKFLFKNKVVLDVGAGTGILSLFCAKAGAKHVYAVECSQMADMAKEIVQTNGYSDVITVLKGKVEEIELPVAHVDVIISEWMGYFLLFENMLNTVLYARDKWLINNGIILPDKALLYLTAIEDAEYKEDKIEFWNDVYGFDMSCIRKQAMAEPLVDTVDLKQIVTSDIMIKMMDISEMTFGDVSFTAPFKLVAERNDFIHAFMAYFNVQFTQCHRETSFSTDQVMKVANKAYDIFPAGPRSKATHWKQTVLYLDEVLTICKDEVIYGNMTVEPNKKNPRDLEITIDYTLNGKRSQVSSTQHYKMR